MEGIKRPEIPFSNSCLGELENHPATISAAGSRRAVEPATAQNHPSSGACGAVRAACESVNYAEGPISMCCPMNFVNRAQAVRATGRSHSINIAALIHCDPCAGSGAIISARECMDHCLGPGLSGFGQLVNYSASAFTITGSTSNCRAV